MQGVNNHSLHFSFVYFTGLVGISEMYYIFNQQTDLDIKNGLKTQVSMPVQRYKNLPAEQAEPWRSVINALG